MFFSKIIIIKKKQESPMQRHSINQLVNKKERKKVKGKTKARNDRILKRKNQVKFVDSMFINIYQNIRLMSKNIQFIIIRHVKYKNIFKKSLVSIQV